MVIVQYIKYFSKWWGGKPTTCLKVDTRGLTGTSRRPIILQIVSSTFYVPHTVLCPIEIHVLSESPPLESHFIAVLWLFNLLSIY